ncbi:translation elongation factor Ts [Patescibacteria group bacterium]|nr:translation elongation factor Ts [Patescibacteria group bacterium]
MKVDMQLLKQLRDITLASLKDCSEALVEAQGDLEKAQEILRKNGSAKAAKKADRETNEGIVKFASNGNKHVGLKLLCETDFVARNDQFQVLVASILDKLQSSTGTFADINAADAALVEELHGMVTHIVATLGENIKLADIYSYDGVAYAYNHPGNKVAALVFYTGEGDAAQNAAKEVALQAAAMNPTYLSMDQVPQADKDNAVAGERDALVASGKPADMIDKILEGKMQKALSEVVLLEQESIRDGAKKVKELLPAGVSITQFIRLSV